MKKRNEGIELLRIISMIMILILHYLGHGGVLDNLSLNNFNYYIVWILEGICFVAVNVYVLITGYFMYTSNFKLKKLIILWLQILFYSASIYLILYLLGFVSINFTNLLKVFTPITSTMYWFATVYMCLYILSIFLNKFLKNLNKKEHITLIIILAIMFSIIPTVNIYGAWLNFGSGYGIAWFIVLYIVAAFIRKYYNRKHISKRLVINYIIFTLLTPISKFILVWLQRTILSNFISTETIKILESKIYSYNAIFVFLSSICIFLIFLNHKPKFIKKFILRISPLTFAVYLIHDNEFLRGILWSYINPIHNIKYIYIHLPLTVILIFFVCIIIDYIRNLVFNKLINQNKLEYFCDYIENIIKNKIKKLI